MKKIELQHGDVVLEIVAEMPDGVKKVKLAKDTFCLEKGEGIHEHTIETDFNKLADRLDVWEDENGNMYFKAKEKLTLNHVEHGKQTIYPNKIYRKNVERVFDYDKLEERKVVD